MLRIGGLFPINCEIPVSTEVEVEGEYPCTVKLFVEGTLFVRGTIPLNYTLPVNTNVPIDGEVRIAGETNYEGLLPVHGSIPVEGEIPIRLQMPVDAQCEPAVCPPRMRALPVEDVKIEHIVRRRLPGEQLQFSTSHNAYDAESTQLEPIIAPSSNTQTNVQRFVRPTFP